MKRKKSFFCSIVLLSRNVNISTRPIGKPRGKNSVLGLVLFFIFKFIFYETIFRSLHTLSAFVYFLVHICKMWPRKHQIYIFPIFTSSVNRRSMVEISATLQTQRCVLSMPFLFGNIIPYINKLILYSVHIHIPALLSEMFALSCIFNYS